MDFLEKKSLYDNNSLKIIASGNQANEFGKNCLIRTKYSEKFWDSHMNEKFLKTIFKSWMKFFKKFCLKIENPKTNFQKHSRKSKFKIFFIRKIAILLINNGINRWSVNLKKKKDKDWFSKIMPKKYGLKNFTTDTESKILF